MKKTYIEPVLTVVTLGTMTILSGSVLDPNSPSVTVKDEEWHTAFGTKEDDWDDELWDD